MVTVGIYGIDLGTTNSCIALVNRATDKSEVRPNSTGELTTPSAVYFEKDNPEPVVGKEAKRWARIAPSRVCLEVKRHMGEDDWRFDVRGKQYRPEAISAFILKKVVRDALLADDTPEADATPVVISIPAYFGDGERRATRAAGQGAGLNVKDLVPEPVAAAFSYGFGRATSPQNLLVYDLGGGTFDVTVVRVDGKSAHTVATEGVRLLGGADWDRELVHHIRERIKQAHGVDLPVGEERGLDENPELSQQLYFEAENAKMALSATNRTSATVHFGGQSYSVEITVDELDSLTKALLDRTVDKTREAIAAAERNGVKTIDKLLLVGGSSRMRQVKKRLQEELGFEGQLHDPDQAIAKGAALVGRLIEQGKYAPETAVGGKAVPSLSVLSFVNSKSLGIRVRRGESTEEFVDYLIPRNSKLPYSQTKTYYTIQEQQSSFALRVMEQRQEPSEVVEENTLVHEKPLQLPVPLPLNSPLEVTYSLDSQGLLHIRVKEPKSGKDFEVEVDRRGKISDQEIKDLKAEVALTH